MRYLLLWICIVAGLYGEEPFVVIGSREFPADHLTQQQVKQIYLKRMRFVQGVPLLPINYPALDPFRNHFEGTMLHLSQKQLKRYWAKEHYLGQRPPLVQASVESAVAFVREVKGAIAYIPASQLPEGVRVLYREGERP